MSEEPFSHLENPRLEEAREVLKSIAMTQCLKSILRMIQDIETYSPKEMRQKIQSKILDTFELVGLVDFKIDQDFLMVIVEYLDERKRGN